MKIESLSNYPPYRKNSTAAPAKNAAASPPAQKTDVAEFNRGQASPPDKSLLSLKSTLLRDAAQATPAQSLAELKTAVREGRYYRSTDELVNAILGSQTE